MSMLHLTSSTPRYPRINLPLSLQQQVDSIQMCCLRQTHTYTWIYTYLYIAETSLFLQFYLYKIQLLYFVKYDHIQSPNLEIWNISGKI